MKRLPSVPLAILACSALLAAGGATRMSAAAYTSSLSVGGSGVTVDRLSNYFQVTPGSQASGDVDTLSIALGTVSSPRTVDSVFTVTNVSGQTQTATLALQGPPQVSALLFAASGTGSVSLTPGASSAVSVTTSSSTAGRGSGTIRLSLSGSTWLYREYSLSLDAAPSTPASLSATAISGGRIALSWAASATTANLAGYDLWRSSGGPWAKVNGSLLTGTSYTDTATANGTTYSYKVRAVSSDAVALESVDSMIAIASADATPPVLPNAVQLVNGGGQGNQYVNLGNRTNLSVSVTLPATSLSSDVVTVSLSNGGSSVTKTAPATGGAGTVTVIGLNASSLADGTITIAATATDAAGNVSTQQSASASKDTVAPGAPTASYTDQNNGPDQIIGTAEANATVTATQTAPSASGPYTVTASGAGAYTLTVARVDGKNIAPVTVTYLVTATDAAGNTGAATTLTFADKR
jgi:hypothetical protein